VTLARRLSEEICKYFVGFCAEPLFNGEMHEESDVQLLRDYAEDGNEAAFRELVTRHTDLVYSAALRQVFSPDWAGDITQSVFTDLARKAKPVAEKLQDKGSLAGWLHRGTRYAALSQLRDTRCRLANERQAMEQLLTNSESAPDWEHIRPVLDEALDSLGEEDREALLLRYFKNHDFRAVGLALGVSDDAAQKRVSRAVEGLREFFVKRGVTVGASGLVVLISANAVQAAPAGLAAAITAAALSGTTITTTAVIAATKAIAMTTLQKTLVTVTVAVLAGAGLYEARQAANARAEAQTLQQQQTPLTEQIKQLQSERDETARQLASLREDNERLNRDTGELLKLRGEVPRLRNALKELALRDAATTSGATNANDQIELEAKALSAKAHLLKQLFEQMPERRIPELKYWGDQSLLIMANGADLETDAGISRAMSDRRQEAKELFATLLTSGLDSYTRANAGQLPPDISQLKPYVTGVDDVILQRYQMIKTGNVSNLQSGEKVIAEKAAVDEHYDTLFQFGIRTWSWQGIGANNLHGSGGSNRAAQ
jgi:RNA polymerase sigma factor (sigma-70 family)